MEEKFYKATIGLYALDKLPNDSNNCVYCLRIVICSDSRQCGICGDKATCKCQECSQLFYDGCCQKSSPAQKKNSSFTSSIYDDSDICTGIEQSHHDLGGVAIFNDTQCCSNDQYFNDEEIFTQAMLIATLAKRIKTFLKRNDSKVTGQKRLLGNPANGKSLCFKFSAIYQRKMSIIITPIISLMVDQVTNALSQEINAAYLFNNRLASSAKVTCV